MSPSKKWHEKCKQWGCYRNFTVIRTFQRWNYKSQLTVELVEGINRNNITGFLQGLFRVPHRHSDVHITPCALQGLPLLLFSFSFVLQELLQEQDIAWKPRKDTHSERHTIKNIDWMQKYADIFAYRRFHHGGKTWQNVTNSRMRSSWYCPFKEQSPWS